MKVKIIGENIHIISKKVKDAINNRDAAFLQDLAARQVEAGAWGLDLNVGPRKRDGHEVLPWLVEIIWDVVDVPLSLDTTNLTAIEAALESVDDPSKIIINSTSAEPERLEKVPLVAKKYGTKLIALTMGKGAIPVSADDRVNIALEKLIPRMEEVGFPIEDLIIDPLVLTVSGLQEYCPQCVEAIRTLKVAWEPPLKTIGGLSNVSNGVPREMRPLINRVYCAQLMGAGIDMMIADPLDEKLMEVIRIIEERDDSTPVGRLYLTIYDKTAAMEEVTPDDVDMNDPEQVAIWKTLQVLENKVIYTDSYLKM